MPSSAVGQTEQFVRFHKYFQTIRSHLGILLGSFPDWSDFKRRVKVSFTGEIHLQWVTRRAHAGNVKRYRKGQALFFRSLPDFRKPYSTWDSKEPAIPILWDNLPPEIMAQEYLERTQLADRLLLDVRDSARTKARTLAGLSGTSDQHLMDFQKELLKTLAESVKRKPMRQTSLENAMEKYIQLTGVATKKKEFDGHLLLLDSKELVTYRKTGNSGVISITDLGKETLKLLTS